MPFPHPVGRKEVGFQGVAEFLLRFAVDAELVDVCPEIEQTDEIGIGVNEAAVLLVGGFLLLQRPFARILD